MTDSRAPLEHALGDGEDFELVNPLSDPRYNDYWRLYHSLMERKGVSPDRARTVVRTDATVIGALAVRRGDADALICGVEGQYRDHLRHIEDIIGRAEGVRDYSALSLLITPKGTFFVADTYVSDDPDVDELVEMTIYAAEAVRRVGMTPKVALVSHSSFCSHDTPAALKMREAVRIDREPTGELGPGTEDKLLERLSRTKQAPTQLMIETMMWSKAPEISQRSGVSVRVTICNYENLMSSALKRAIRLGETEAAPRISDLGALVASTTGKIELESIGDTSEEKILARLVQRAVLNVFNRAFSAPELEEVVAAFQNGATFVVSDGLPSREYARQLESVPALGAAVRKLDARGPATTAAAVEFVLEGLHLAKKVNKETQPGQYRYRR